MTTAAASLDRAKVQEVIEDHLGPFYGSGALADGICGWAAAILARAERAEGTLEAVTAACRVNPHTLTAGDVLRLLSAGEESRDRP